MKKNSMQHLTASALLIALGIIIPQVMPKIVIGPASFTLASHVPVFLAMFISPFSAVAVALGTALGFLLTGMPAIIALRALSHVVFAFLGAFILQKHPEIVLSMKKFMVFNVFIGLIHSILELGVVSIFFSAGNLGEAYYTQGYFVSIILLMGVGGLIHSLIDYSLAYFVARSISQRVNLPIFFDAKHKLKDA